FMTKKIYGIVLLLFSLAIFWGCTTYVPIASSDAAMANPSVEFTVLGTVTMKLNNVFGGGQMGVKGLLLKKAKETYPEADMVVDVTYTGIASSVGSDVYIAEGTVIQLK
ncbi:MAG: hypothetical protein AAF975_06855, partial [Spirochaetota bacterium]